MMRRMALLPLLLSPVMLQAQESSDELFTQARRLSGPKHREEARALLRKALERSPDYHDIRIHLARTLAWDERYDEARQELGRVLSAAPGNLEAREALIDVEVWSDHPAAALAACEAGIQARPGEPSLLYRQARVLKSMGNYPKALELCKQALALNPNYHEARLLRDDLVELRQRSKVSLDETYEHYDKTFEAPWHLTALSLGHRFDRGSVIGRVSHATRYGESGNQIEVDAYPKWKPGTYFYLNAGWSRNPVFPRYRAGAEVFHNFPAGLEGSLGFRHLGFESSSVTLYTGSLGKYYRDYLFTLRSYYTPSAIGSSLSGSLSARRYFGDTDTYLSASLGTGTSPDQTAPNAEVLRLNSRNISLGGQTRLGRSWVSWASLAFEDQELPSGDRREHFTANLGLEYRF